MTAADAPLSAIFFSAWPGPAAVVRDDVELEAALVELWKQGQSAWPGIALSPPQFVASVGERARIDRAPLAAVQELRAADVFLACACAHGLSGAIRAFDTALLARVPTYLRRLNASPELADETRQLLLTKLFLSQGGRAPKIAQYSGRGSLEGWLRVTTVRTAQNLLDADRSRQTLVDEAATVAQAVAPVCDPEHELMTVSHRDAFVAAFREAMVSLGQRDRALLRFTFVERMTPARIGAVYGVHRTTVMRWIEAAQAEVLAGTEARLMARLHLSPSGCASLFLLVKSRLDLALSSLFTVDS